MSRPPFTLRIGSRSIQFPLVAWLTVIWVLLWDRPTPGGVVAGLVLAVLLVLVFPFPPMDPGLRFRPVGIARFVARFGFDLLRSVGPLAWQTVGTGRPGRVNSVLEVRLRSHSDLVTALTSIALSATPGTVIVDIRRTPATLFIHALGVADDEAVALVRRDVLAVEARVVRAFGTREDQRAIGGGRP
ncbi:Na+/H+ antiporter subunit E [Actinomadura atramentaria]|uniref:Na+/H+ antiporter subunit E n=1 Tax=Actinomadura atramentaria TaxID=1990 RepID=UPI0003676623|nr:Na+/H+ antiporter subunit E [Actinomadura atramentaria]